jgi:hypothetical protein
LAALWSGMHRLALALSVLAVSASTASGQDHPLCKSLRSVAAEAKGRHAPLRITASVAGQALTCRPLADDAAAQSFCDLAVQIVGPEGGHMLPWRVRQCVDTMIAGAVVETADEVVGPRGRKRIVHMAADMGGGVRLDIRQPAEDAGRYDLVIWPNR